jgi:hypothetical protein
MAEAASGPVLAHRAYRSSHRVAVAIGAAIAAVSIVSPSRATAEVAADAAAPTIAASAPPRAPIVHEHSIGFGYHALIMRTESSDQYAIQGPSIGYTYSVARRWGFLAHLTAFFPLLGNMDGPSGDFSGSLVEIYDQHRYGVDLLLAGARRFPIRDRIKVTAAAGPHVQWFSLSGDAYSPVEAASLGVGFLGKVDYAINGWLAVSSQLAVGIDFIDPADHRNGATIIAPLSWTFALDARH